jgi:hypothetical protein
MLKARLCFNVLFIVAFSWRIPGSKLELLRGPHGSMKVHLNPLMFPGDVVEVDVVVKPKEDAADVQLKVSHM